MKKWPVTLSTTEPYNYIGLVQVRQSNRASEILEATITQNGKPYDLTGCKVYFEAIIGNNAVELGCKVIDAQKGIIEYIFSDYTLQKPGAVTANLKITREGFTDTTQDFTYFVLRAVSQTEIETGSYWQSVQDLIQDLEDFINSGMVDFDKWMENSQEQYEKWFDSIKEILMGIDPGGKMLKELMDARKDVQGALHGSISERLLADMQYIYEELMRHHYTLKAFEISSLEILQDDNFSKNHQVEKVGTVDFDVEDGALVIATIDDKKQNVFKLEKVGSI